MTNEDTFVIVGCLLGAFIVYNIFLMFWKGSTIEGLQNQTNQSLGTKDYCSVIKKVKKDNITHDNIGEIMLCQIPGVSSVSAIAILGKFKTLPELIKALQQDPTCLTGVTTCDANGKSRKISKTTIETIVKYLS